MQASRWKTAQKYKSARDDLALANNSDPSLQRQIIYPGCAIVRMSDHIVRHHDPQADGCQNRKHQPVAT
jgi:hypothetical protein